LTFDFCFGLRFEFFPANKAMAYNLDEIAADEQRTIEAINNRYAQEIGFALSVLDLFLACVGVLSANLGTIDFRTDKGKARIVILLLASRAFDMAKCIFDLAVKGYFVQAGVLVRAFQETVSYCEYYQRFPAEADRWIGDQKPSLSKVRNTLKAQGDISGQERQTTESTLHYWLNKYVHTHPHSARIAFGQVVDETQDRGDIFIQVGPSDDIEDFSTWIGGIIGYLLWIVTILWMEFKPELEHDEEFVSQFSYLAHSDFLSHLFGDDSELAEVNAEAL
jgi:hypothetical protein